MSSRAENGHRESPRVSGLSSELAGKDGSSPADAFSSEEGAEIAVEARRGRALDRRLANELSRPRARTTAVSGEYVHDLGARGRMPVSLEHRLVRQAREGAGEARAELVEAFLPLIGSVARNYRTTSHVTRVELLQEGVVGLLRALERYDPELGVPFWAYASWWVRQAMQQLVAELSRPVVLSDRALRQLAEVKDAHARLRWEISREPTLRELGERTGLSDDQLANLLAADRPPRGLEEPIAGEEGEVGTFGELIADPLAEDEYERVVTHVAGDQLRDLLSGLSDRERSVLRARFGLGGEKRSLRQIARDLGVSGERVRQIEGRALGKLRAAALGKVRSER